MKINLIIADHDEEYIRYLTEYIRNSDYRSKLIIQSYSRIDSFESYSQHHGNALLLVCSQWMDALNDLLREKEVIILSESSMGTPIGNHRSIFRYQPLNELLTKLIHSYTDDNDHQGIQKIPSVDHNATQVISVYSTIGGGGKTTTAINLTKQLSELHKQVLYLNLETVSSLEMFIQPLDKDDFARVLYYAKSNRSELSAELSKLIQYDPILNCDYLPPLKHMKDVEDIQAEDMILIIESLKQLNRFDVIIIDLDSALHPRIWAAMEAADHLIWLLSDDVQCKIKTKKIWEAFIQWYGMIPELFAPKIHFTLNKYTGSSVVDFDAEGFRCESQLPYNPHWKSVHEGVQVYTSDMFNRSMIKLYWNMQHASKELVHG